MNKSPQISIIIPIYNSEKYLSRCIESILNQKYNNYEIILINDGSKDSSGTIGDQYAQKYSNIKIIHQENKGVSCARNIGLKYAIGQYICFIDSDDWIDQKYLSNFQFESDFCIQGYITHHNHEIEISYKPLILNKNVGPELIKRGIQTAPWGKLFKREIIEKYHIIFPENISYGEDSVFIYRYLTHCVNAIVVTGSYYHYGVYSNSLGHKKYPQKELIEMFKLQYEYLNQLFATQQNNYLHYKTLLCISEMIKNYQLSYSNINSEPFLLNIRNKHLHIGEKILLIYPYLFNKYVHFYSKVTNCFNDKL